MTRPMEEKRFRETVEKAFEDEPRIAGPAVSDLRDEAVRARASESDLRLRLEWLQGALKCPDSEYGHRCARCDREVNEYLPDNERAALAKIGEKK